MADFKAGFAEEAIEFRSSFGEVQTVVSGVSSVNGKSGAVVLSASDVGAYTQEEVGRKLEVKANKSELPTKLSDLEDDTVQTGGFRIKFANWASTTNNSIYAVRTLRDYNQKVIHETYATKTELATTESIAKGRATGYVFDTLSELETWLENSENASKLVLGDNLYIRATDVPDYWWDGEIIQPLETQKVDLSEYATKAELTAAIGEALEGEY